MPETVVFQFVAPRPDTLWADGRGGCHQHDDGDQ
jgi:hypothetical protein